MKSLIGKLISALHDCGLKNSPEEIADVIWYASITSSFDVSRNYVRRTDSPADKEAARVTPNTGIDEIDNDLRGGSSKILKNETQGSESIKNDGADLYAPGSVDSTVQAIPFCTPGGRALPNALQLGRALRPLIKRIPSSTKFILDENASASQIAQSRIWLPVIKSAPVRWFDLVLIVENSPSMRLWHQTARELRLLFEHLGAFRDIRVWRLETNSDDQNFGIYTEGSKALHSYKELIEPALPRLIVIATDCISPAWQNSELLRCLNAWGGEHPLSMIHMLPQRLWSQTGLRNAQLVKVHAPFPGGANRSLQYHQPTFRWQSRQSGGQLPVPLMTLEPEYIDNWARFITGSGSSRTMPAFIFKASTMKSKSPRRELSHQENLARFKAVASPLAFRLACCLAAVPLHLPIMRLVQRVMLPKSGQIHLAEFFLSGLIERISSFEVTATDEIEYDFLPGVRKALLKLTLIPDTLQVQEIVSEFINKRYGESINFHALIGLPIETDGQPYVSGSATLMSRSFARVTAEVLGVLSIHSIFQDNVVKNQKKAPPRSLYEDVNNKTTEESAVAPKNRVNITYRPVFSDSAELELPLKLFVIGDFTGRSDETPLKEREPININKDIFNDVLSSHKIEIHLRVLDFLGKRKIDKENKIWIRVPIKSMADFAPDKIIKIVPELSKELESYESVLAFRLLLSESSKLAEHIESVLVGKKYSAAFEGIKPTYDLQKIDDLVLGVLNDLGADVPDKDSYRYGIIFRGINLLVKNIKDLKEIKGIKNFTDKLISAHKNKLSAQIDEILHHPKFQKIESAWRSLEYLVENTDFRENIRIDIFQANKEELEKDFADNSSEYKLSHFDKYDSFLTMRNLSGLYRHVYAYDEFGGTPVGAIVANYEFGPSSSDIKLLANIAAVAACSHAPLIAAASSKFFAMDDFSALPTVKDLGEHFEGIRYTNWKILRESEISRYIGLTMPRFLLRHPYEPGGFPMLSFHYAENVKNHEYYLWGNAAFAFATRLTHSFARYRWCPNIIGRQGGGAVENLPLRQCESGGKKVPNSIEVLVTDKREYELSEEGFIVLTKDRNSDNSVFFSANSIKYPEYSGGNINEVTDRLNYKLGTQLPYVFVIQRIAHYLKVLNRDKVGSSIDRMGLEKELNMWIRQYVVDQEDASAEVRSRRFLRQAKVEVKDVVGELGIYLMRLSVRPHFTSMGSDFILSLVGKLEK